MKFYFVTFLKIQRKKYRVEGFCIKIKINHPKPGTLLGPLQKENYIYPNFII
ncbi:MAG: hypothetical protein Sapg2KO_02160 [Saprospiraceae bacterium]